MRDPGTISAVLCTFVLLCLTPVTAAASGAAEDESLPDSIRPRDTREEWTVGITELGGRGLSPDAAYVTQSIPLLLRDELSNVSDHSYGNQEIAAYRSHLKEQSLIAAGKELDRALSARDRAEEAQELQRRREQVVTARSNLRRLERLEESEIAVNTVKPVDFVGDAGGLLPLSGDVSHLAKRDDLDAIIYGHVEDLDGFVEIEVSVYSRFQEKTVFSQSVITRPVAAYDAIEELRHRLVEYVLGRPWTDLTVTTPNEEGSLYVDGRFVGIGEARLPRTTPGERTLEVVLPDGTSERKVVELAPYEERTETLRLEPPETGAVSIESEPPGASVYVESTWRGTTPMTFPRPVREVPFRMTLDGYNESLGAIGPGSPATVRRDLVPDAVDQAAVVEERRDAFYGAFGAFIISLPIPIIFNGLTQSIVSLFPPEVGSNPDLSTEENQRLATLGTVYFYVSRGGLFVSSGLFVNMAVQLARYVEAGQHKHQPQE
ncbi:MAG: PEGA domain-containing protein [Spirochaetaceae bacterium]